MRAIILVLFFISPLLLDAQEVSMKQQADTTEKPLVIVDGIIYNGPLDSLKPGDIASMVIVKQEPLPWACRAVTSKVVVITMKKKEQAVKKVTQGIPGQPVAKTISKNITIGPNPARHIFNINLSENSGNFSLSLLNMQGQVVKSWSNLNGQRKRQGFDTSAVPPGLYVVAVRAGGKITAEKLFICE